MKTIKADSSRVKRDIVGRLSGNRVGLGQRRDVILVTDEVKASDVGYAGIVTTSRSLSPLGCSSFYLTDMADMSYSDGDIVSLTSSGEMHFLWEADQENNALFLTEACSCHCLMCPQPPKPHDPIHMSTARKILDLVPSGYDGEICITGGEPTLCGDGFLEILGGCRELHPNARIIVLTNGKSFSSFKFSKSVAELDTKAIFAVSLHADIDILHDKIVGSEGSFRKTQMGLYNLARLKQLVEIRVVVSKLNYQRLEDIAEHVYRNYPFAFHVTFMALEVTGLALDNFDDVWIDPFEYKVELEEALHELHRRGVRVSAYNHPLCLTHKGAWQFARQSISAWKNDYLSECEPCAVRDKCCGVFTTSGDMLSRNIKSIPK